MFIKSLRLKGFKSFADETGINFLKGINCIVGPNGCGKSNVVDALKWVVGDTSVKGMRASNIKDMVFKGSEGKRASRTAEVSIAISREEILPFSENEIILKRRIRLNGESEFFINGRKKRLKDIQDFFSSIGLGNKAYAFFEQGKIDRILNLKPYERKNLIEEAAGTASFKERKKEAIAKLQEAEENLKRLKQVIAEVGRGLNSLKEQAEKAKLFKILTEEERELSFKLLGTKLRKLKAEKEKNEQLLRQAQAERDDLEGKVKLEEKRSESLDQEKKVLAEKVKSLSKKLYELERAKGENEVKLNFLKREIDRANTEIPSLNNKLEEKQKRIESTTLDETKKLDELSNLKKTLESEKKNKEVLREKISKIREKLSEKERQHRTLRTNLSRINSEISKLKLDIARSEEQFKSINSLKEGLPTDIKSLEAREKDCTDESDKTVRDLKDLEQSLNEERLKLKDLTSERIRVKSLIDEEEERANLLNNELVSKRSRAESIEAISENVNFGKLEKKIVEEGQKGRVKGYIGLFVNLIQVDEGWEKIVEAYIDSLGAGIILKSFDDVLWVKKRIKGNGKAVILTANIDDIKPRYIEDATPLCSVVKPRDSRIKNLVRAVFNNVFFSSNAKVLSAKYPDCVFIDKDLNVLSGRGSIVGKAKDTSFLELRKELENLKLEAQEVETKLEMSRGKLGTLRQEFEEINDEIESTNEKIRSLEVKKSQKTSRLKDLNERLNDYRQKLKALMEKQRGLDGNTGTIQANLEKSKSKILSLNKDKKVILEKLNTTETEINDTRERLNGYENSLSNYTSNVKVLNEKLISCKNSVESLKKSAELDKNDVVQIKKKVLNLSEGRKKNNYSVQSLEDQNKNTVKQIEKLKSEIESVLKQKTDIEGTIAKINGTVHVKSKAILTVQSKINDINLELVRISTNEESTLKAISDMGKNESEALLIEGVSLNEEAIRQKLASVKERISRIGAVNPLAIDEFKKIKERHDLLVEQQEDILKSIDNLREAIEKVDAEIKVRFDKTLKLVDKAFSHSFKRVFGGGKARIKLIDDGVEIEAKPPGKKHNNIMLLSGGERTLVALSVLYALYSVRPAPFVVLDEVDAALDPTNVMRFRELLREISETTQVIVVTHNRLTMEISDIIYGITMEIPGVSKVINTSFESATT